MNAVKTIPPNGKSLKQKMIVRNMIVMLLVFIAVLIFYALQNYGAYNRQIEKTTTSFRRNLDSTSRLLISDKQKALRTYAEDNSWTTLREILIENVRGRFENENGEAVVADQQSLIMAAYFRNDRQTVAWVTPETPDGVPTGLPPGKLQQIEETTDWALSLKGITQREVQLGDHLVIQYATPIYASSSALGVDIDDSQEIVDPSVDAHVGSLVYGFSTAQMERDLAEAKSEYQADLLRNLMFLLLVSILALIGGFYATRRQAATITSPLAQLTGAADSIASGDYNVRVDLNSGDEIEVLASSFNKMTTDLKRSYDELAELNKTLEEKVQQRTKELVASERKFRILFEESADAILLGDENELFDCNPAMLRLMGCEDKNVLLAMSPDDLSPKQQPEGALSAELIRDKYKMVLEEGSQLFEWTCKRLDNSEFPSEIVVTGFELDDRPVLHKVYRDITERKKTEEMLRKAQQRLLETAHSSGMAEIATGVLHNIGNILNSVNISTEEMALTLKNSKVKGFLKANDMIRNHSGDLGTFFTSHPKGKLIPGYYLSLGEAINEEQTTLTDEVTALINKVNMMRDVISTQQNYAKASLYTEDVSVIDLIEDSLKLNLASLQKQGVKIVKNYTSDPKGSVAKVKLVHVLTNLIKNAKEAMQENDGKNKEQILELIMRGVENNEVIVMVKDNGVGISQENKDKIFNHGFTTKPTGHGFGLHTCANFMTEMGGTLEVSSEGPGKGAVFEIRFPLDERGPEFQSPPPKAMLSQEN
ncbi:ATP-binding protein [Acanthopleuribacter pedis]|uniref:histidine kinase n=1 Tax=Acanthopleuribacter pedis TaxID=442870 RepID=A0A8J7U3R4_9BACT|nr:ATP-binding protein [Acanthopleuribacter pedis]MBO1319034.1 HAMP domain-containing protein [Acanthopleuribacter pedis]